MFSRPKILLLVSLLFVALLDSIPTYLLNFEFFYHSSLVKPIGRLFYEVQKWGNHTIFYQSLLLSTTVLDKYLNAKQKTYQVS